MQLTRHLLVLLVFISIQMGTSFAQDIHFTQYDMSPLTLNPAHSGKFGGSVRIGGIFRDQWASIIDRQYTTPSAWVDAPIIRGFRKSDWVGVGLMFFTDKTGKGSLTHSAIKLSAAYHLALDKKGKNILSIGGQYGQENRSVDNAFAFDDELRGGIATSADDLLFQNGAAKGDNNNISAGIIFTSKINKTTDVNIGFSMQNINKPKYNLLGADAGSGGTAATVQLPTRSILHGRFNVALNEKWDITPTFIFQTMGGADEIMLQGRAGYLWDKQKDIRFNAGLGYRLGDAVNLLLGAQIKNLQLGLAYDVTTSDLANTNRNRGGFEIAANYIFKIYKPAVVKPMIICPRF